MGARANQPQPNNLPKTSLRSKVRKILDTPEQAKRFMSDEHFTVDRTLIQAWASQKSFRKNDGSDENQGRDGTNFHDSKRSNETHESISDPDARLYKKSYGRESKLAYLGHVLVENRNGLIVVEHGWQDHAPCRLRNQPELPLAGREAVRLAEADSRTRPGKGARTGQGRLRLRLRMSAHNLLRLPRLIAQQQA